MGQRLLALWSLSGVSMRYTIKAEYMTIKIILGRFKISSDVYMVKPYHWNNGRWQPEDGINLAEGQYFYYGNDGNLLTESSSLPSMQNLLYMNDRPVSLTTYYADSIPVPVPLDEGTLSSALSFGRNTTIRRASDSGLSESRVVYNISDLSSIVEGSDNE